MVTKYTPNASRTRTTVTELLPRGRRRVLGTIRRTVFVAAKPLSAAALDSVVVYMQNHK